MAMSGSSGLRAASFGTTTAAAQRSPPTREWRRLADFPGSTAVRHKRPAGSRDTRAETLLFPASAVRPGRLLPSPVLWRPPECRCGAIRPRPDLHIVGAPAGEDVADFLARHQNSRRAAHVSRLQPVAQRLSRFLGN